MKIHVEYILNIFLSVMLIAIFICVFFFTYASKVEKNIVINQTKDLVYDLTDTVFQFQTIKDVLRDPVAKLTHPDYSSDDKKVEDENKALLKKTIKIIVICSALVYGMVLGLAYIYDVSLIKILIPNIIILVFVALTEYFFLTFIAANYISFDPNYAKYSILKTLQDYANE